MNATAAQIKERLPIWSALSEFFLDTELQPNDYERIAQKLAAGNYSENEIEKMLIHEVCPVCRWNALSPAGEWAGFDDEWLMEKIGPRYEKRIRFEFLFKIRHRWMYAKHWKKVKMRISEIRRQAAFAMRIV